MALAAAAAIAAAAVVSVVAVAFALYAGLAPWVGAAWAAAIVAAVMALVIVCLALMVRSRVPGHRPRHAPADEPDASMVQKIVGMARERPLLAAGLALGAGVFALRNPKLIAVVMAAFMEGRQSTR